MDPTDQNDIQINNYASLKMTDYHQVSYEESEEHYNHYSVGAHGMFYMCCPSSAVALITLRFDGFLGFPGGMGEEGEQPVEALNREVHEEIGVTNSEYLFSQNDLLLCHINHRTKLRLYFFTKKLINEDFQEVERGALNAPDYGVETYGIIRIPLNTSKTSTFLQHQFIGNSALQIRYAIEHLDLS